MKIQQIDISKVKPYDKNPRNNEAAVDAVAKSIEQFGFQQPIVVDKDMVIIVGHTRLKAAKKLKLKTVPVVIADNLTDQQARAYRLADNQTNQLAEWNFDLLNEEIAALDDFDMSEFGFEDVTLPDYSDANQEINIDELDGYMIIKLTYTEDEYWKVKNKLSEIADTPEKAVMELIDNAEKQI